MSNSEYYALAEHIQIIVFMVMIIVVVIATGISAVVGDIKAKKGKVSWKSKCKGCGYKACS